MKKSVISRIKITKKQKILRRKAYISHLKTRKSKKNILAKRKKHYLDYPVKKVLNYNSRQ